MQTIEDKILVRIKKCGRGKLYADAVSFILHQISLHVDRVRRSRSHWNGLLERATWFVLQGAFIAIQKLTGSLAWAYNIRQSMKLLKR